MAKKLYTVIDLFSGAGGLTSGFVKAGFRPLLAVEKERDFALTYETNFVRMSSPSHSKTSFRPAFSIFKPMW